MFWKSNKSLFFFGNFFFHKLLCGLVSNWVPTLFIFSCPEFSFTFSYSFSALHDSSSSVPSSLILPFFISFLSKLWIQAFLQYLVNTFKEILRNWTYFSDETVTNLVTLIPFLPFSFPTWTSSLLKHHTLTLHSHEFSATKFPHFHYFT